MSRMEEIFGNFCQNVLAFVWQRTQQELEKLPSPRTNGGAAHLCPEHPLTSLLLLTWFPSVYQWMAWTDENLNDSSFAHLCIEHSLTSSPLLRWPRGQEDTTPLEFGKCHNMASHGMVWWNDGMLGWEMTLSKGAAHLCPEHLLTCQPAHIGSALPVSFLNLKEHSHSPWFVVSPTTTKCELLTFTF